MAEEHFKKETEGKIGTVLTTEDARKAHHLATADPEPERDGVLTGPAHEAKYNLDRADDSAAEWVAAGVHPLENRALVPGDKGYEESVVPISEDGPVVVNGEIRAEAPGKSPGKSK